MARLGDRARDAALAKGGEHFGKPGKALQVFLRLAEVFVLTFGENFGGEPGACLAGEVVEYGLVRFADHRFNLAQVGFNPVAG